MNSELEMIKSFHKLIGAPIAIPFEKDGSKEYLQFYDLKYISDLFFKHWIKDKTRIKLLRAHLILEETAEVIEAFIQNDKVALLDGLADLLYVTLGTAITYNLPIVKAFHEVHRSNMTKSPPKGDIRAQDKGTTFEPPNLKRILDEKDKNLFR